jgi:hypothetical protein
VVDNLMSFLFPTADATHSGVITSGAQTFGGVKTFSSGIITDSVLTNTATSLDLAGTMADGASAIAIKLRSNITYVNPTAKLLSVQNNTTEKFFVDLSGTAKSLAGSGVTAFATVAGAFINLGNTQATLYSDANFTIRAAGHFRVNDGTLYAGNITATPSGNSTLTLTSTQADGASAVGTTINTSILYSTAGAKLLLIQNQAVEFASFDYQGSLTNSNGGTVGTRLGVTSGCYGVWLHSNAISPSLSNYALLDAGGATILNTASGSILFRIGNTPAASLNISTFNSPGAILPLTAGTLDIAGSMADGASAIAIKLRSNITYANAASKLLSIQNNTTEKAYFDKDGGLTISGSGAINGNLIKASSASAGFPASLANAGLQVDNSAGNSPQVIFTQTGSTIIGALILSNGTFNHHAGNVQGHQFYNSPTDSSLPMMGISTSGVVIGSTAGATAANGKLDVVGDIYSSTSVKVASTGNFTLTSGLVVTGSSSAATYTSQVATSGSAIAHKFATNGGYTTGDKLASFFNQSVEKFYIDFAGNAVAVGGSADVFVAAGRVPGTGAASIGQSGASFTGFWAGISNGGQSTANYMMGTTGVTTLINDNGGGIHFRSGNSDNRIWGTTGIETFVFGNYPTSVPVTAPYTPNVRGASRYAVFNLSIAKEAWVAAATTQSIALGTFPAKCRILSVIVDVTTKFAGLAGTIQLQLGKTVGGTEYIVAFDAKTAIYTSGLLDADLGTSINRANAVQGGDIPNWSTTTSLSLTLTSGSGNIGDGVTTTNLTTGAVTVVVTYEILN